MYKNLRIQITITQLQRVLRIIKLKMLQIKAPYPKSTILNSRRIQITYMIRIFRRREQATREGGWDLVPEWGEALADKTGPGGKVGLVAYSS